MPDDRTRRLGFIDSARTLAMALMVQGHVCDNLLSASGKASELYQRHLLVRGLTGPLFFLVSGFAFVVASDSAWHEYGRPGDRLWGRLRRVALLLGVGTLLQIPRWSGPAFTRDDWVYVLRCGVLHTIAWSLLTALGLIALTRSRRAFTLAALGLAALAIAAAPLASASGTMPVALGLLIRTQEGSLFPVVPWIAHFLLGAVAARLYLDVRHLGTSPRRLALFTGSAGATLLLGGSLWQALQPVDTRLLAVWVSDPAVFLSRAGLAWCVFALFALALGRLASRPWLKAVASHALSIYVAHLVVLYGIPDHPGLVQRYGATLDLAQTYLTGPLLFVGCAIAMIALSSFAQALGTRLRAAAARVFLAGARG
ncbi:MAG: DUF1624 domain-containing protein [Deltaproteobacteria bacterium]|nr:DUF1624 domain-containing protein [Deltaproteobacteria bacterium]